MDRSRFRRPVIQTQSQTVKNTLGSLYPVSRADYTRAQIGDRKRATYSDIILKQPEPVDKQPIVNNQPVQLNTVETTNSEPKVDSLPPATLLARQQPIDMSLPGENSKLFTGLIKLTKGRKARLIVSRSLAAALLLIIALGGLFFSETYFKVHQVFQGNATASALNTNPNLLNGENTGRVNILLLGRGGGNHDGPDLTDSMMIASVDTLNHQVTLLSLPRDLWVNVPGAGVMKINAAWQTGEFKYLGKIAPGSTDPKAISAGFNLVDQTVNQVLGVNIDYNVIVDFQAFQQAVDTVGGVSVNVPSDLVDPTMAWENKNNPVLAKAGQQTFNGAQALLYVRSRETSSDFARAQRQRDVLIALKSKIESLGILANPLKLSSLVNTFGNNVATDLSISNAERLYGILSKVNGNSISSLDLDQAPNEYVTTGNVSGQSIVLPKAGLFNYQDIQNFIHQTFKDPYLVKENAKVLVLNGTNTAGLATSLSTKLTAQGVNVIGTANTSSANWPHTLLINLNGHDNYTNSLLENKLGVKSESSLPDKSISTNGADFVIIIGNDEATNSQT